MNAPDQFGLPAPHDSVILVVDDVPQNIQVVGTLLRESGYSVMPATSGTAALQRVQKKVPDLVLLDLMMPDMDGVEVCRHLKADPVTREIPVIFLTASNEMNHLVQALESGAVDYVTKPFNPPELLARVKTHLELKHSRDVILRYSEALRALNDEKNEFMGIAAHDLRNPLSAIQGYAELVKEDADAAGLREISANGGRIHAAADRMVRMVQNLLDANRIERGEFQLNKTPADLAVLASSVVESHRARAGAKQQTLHWDGGGGPAPVVVDPVATLQVLENLVSNALKYSPPGKHVWVRIRTEAGSVRCEVRDEGPGLNEEDQKRLFGKFARLSAKPTGGEQATGLGLSIVKRMVEAMRGRVWCESEAGRGASFVVAFPAA
ncbi:MAG: hybrid sensor histidine kinase/response regulator [Verrucomicrobiota bacterium]